MNQDRPLEPEDNYPPVPGETPARFADEVADDRLRRARDATDDMHVLELKEERLVARKELREIGEVVIRTEVEEVPGRLEVDAYHEEVEVEHVPVGRVVSEREEPWEEDGVLFVPVYEEQLVVVKRLVLKEHLKVRRIATTERQLFQDTVRRDRLVIEDPNNTRLVRERFADPADYDDSPEARARVREDPNDGSGADDPEVRDVPPHHDNPLENLVKRVLG